MHKISLIIPAYNEEKTIGECLKAVLSNANGVFSEIIVVDNASTDHTAQVALSFPGVRVVHEPMKGLTRARECGYQVSTGDVLAFIDADTRMPPGWSDQVRDFAHHESLSCLSGPYVYYDLPSWQRLLVALYWRLLGMPTYYITGYMAVGGNFAIRRSVVRDMGGFDTSIEFYGEDTDIARRSSKFGKVKFSMSFVMYTSGRRLREQGFFRTGYVYVANFLSEVILKRPMHRVHTDIR